MLQINQPQSCQKEKGLWHKYVLYFPSNVRLVYTSGGMQGLRIRATCVCINGSRKTLNPILLWLIHLTSISLHGLWYLVSHTLFAKGLN